MSEENVQSVTKFPKQYRNSPRENVQVEFLIGEDIIGTTQATIEGTDVDNELLALSKYFLGGSLAVRAMKLDNWDSMRFTHNNNVYSY